MGALLDLLMPRECLVCGRRLGARERHLCIWCAADLPLTYYWEQPHNPMADEFNAILERKRVREELPKRMQYAHAAALLFYHHENPYKQIPRALKYGGNVAAGQYFAAQLGRYLSESEAFRDVDTVIPIPLHWQRKWQRGYNQADVIAKALSAALGAREEAGALQRVRRTRSQTALKAEDRLKNVQGVFRLKKPIPEARHVLLVDDTFTTGATLAAGYEAVRTALGEQVRISVATLAVVHA